MSMRGCTRTRWMWMFRLIRKSTCVSRGSRTVFGSMSAQALVERLDAASIANARMNEMPEVWEHPQLAARNRWTEMGSPVGPIPVLRPPATHSDFAPAIGAVPALGAHTDAILGELGFGGDERNRLRAQKAI